MTPPSFRFSFLFSRSWAISRGDLLNNLLRMSIVTTPVLMLLYRCLLPRSLSRPMVRRSTEFPLDKLLTSPPRVLVMNPTTWHVNTSLLCWPNGRRVLLKVPQQWLPLLQTMGSRSTVAGVSRRRSSRSVNRNCFACLPLLQNGRTHLNVKRYTVVWTSGGMLWPCESASYRASSIPTLDLGATLARTSPLADGPLTQIGLPWNSLLLGPLPLVSLFDTIPLQTVWTLPSALGTGLGRLLSSARKSPVNLSNCPRGLLPSVVLRVLSTLSCAEWMFLTLPASRTLALTRLRRQVWCVTGGSVPYSLTIPPLRLCTSLVTAVSLWKPMMKSLPLCSATLDWNASYLPRCRWHLRLVTALGALADRSTRMAR